MDLFKIISITISIIAILTSIGIPLAGHIYKKTRKPKLDIYEFEYQPLTIMYSESGDRIRFNFSIMSQSASCVIRSIEASIFSEAEAKQMKMRWVIINPIHLNWANGMGNIINLNTVTHVHPLLIIAANTIAPLSVDFEPLKNKDFNNTYESILSLSEKKLLKNAEEQESSKHSEFILKNEDFHIQEEKLKTMCFWHCGSYNLTIKLLFDANETFEKTYRFSLNAKEAEILQSNIKKLLLNELSPVSTNPTPLYYDSISKDIVDIATK